MKELHTEILINASQAKIWHVLTDFNRYPEWNPFILHITGELQLNARLNVTIKPEKSQAKIFKPHISKLKENKEFAWLGMLLFKGLFDGHHQFEIKEIEEDQCLLVHKEEFKGILVPMFWKKLDTEIRKGFEAMNQKLKEQAEGI